MALLVDLSVVAFGLLLVVACGLNAFGRFRRMNRFGRRAGERLGGLAEDAGRLGARLDDLEGRAAAHAEQPSRVTSR